MRKREIVKISVEIKVAGFRGRDVMKYGDEGELGKILDDAIDRFKSCKKNLEIV